MNEKEIVANKSLLERFSKEFDLWETMFKEFNHVSDSSGGMIFEGDFLCHPLLIKDYFYSDKISSFIDEVCNEDDPSEEDVLSFIRENLEIEILHLSVSEKVFNDSKKDLIKLRNPDRKANLVLKYSYNQSGKLICNIQLTIGQVTHFDKVEVNEDRPLTRVLML